MQADGVIERYAIGGAVGATFYLQPVATLDLATGLPDRASTERSDVCAVPAAAVVGEAMLAITLARALGEKFGGDSAVEMRRNFEAYLDALEARWPAS